MADQFVWGRLRHYERGRFWAHDSVPNTQPAPGCATPSFSPDGSKIVFSMDGNLMTMNVDGSDPVDLGVGVFSATFTRDGKAILANTWAGGLYLIGLNGGGRMLVSTLSALEAVFSADGQKIFFNLLDDFSNWPPQLPTAQLFVMNADGTNVQQLTFGGLNMSPVVVGKRVMFVSDRAATSVSIYSMKEDGRGVRPVTNSPQWDAFNSVLWWNPDNRGD